MMIVDELMVSVGSTNFDNRSFNLNDEANLNIYDAAFALQQVATFREDLERSRQITLEQWRQRPWTEKLWEHAAAVHDERRGVRRAHQQVQGADPVEVPMVLTDVTSKRCCRYLDGKVEQWEDCGGERRHS